MTEQVELGQLRKGNAVMLQGHPCIITDLTTAKMLHRSSGRDDCFIETWCDGEGCDRRIQAGEVRYACLDCVDFDLCEACEESTVHADGKHVFAKIRPRPGPPVDMTRYRK